MFQHISVVWLSSPGALMLGWSSGQPLFWLGGNLNPDILKVQQSNSQADHPLQLGELSLQLVQLLLHRLSLPLLLMSHLESSNHLSMSLVEVEAELLVQLPLNVQKVLKSSCPLFPLPNFLTEIEHDVVPHVAILFLLIQQEPPLLLQEFNMSIEGSQSHSRLTIKNAISDSSLLHCIYLLLQSTQLSSLLQLPCILVLHLLIHELVLQSND